MVPKAVGAVSDPSRYAATCFVSQPVWVDWVGNGGVCAPWPFVCVTTEERSTCYYTLLPLPSFRLRQLGAVRLIVC